MTAINPNYALRRLAGHTLTEAEYTALLALLTAGSREPVTDTDGRIVTTLTGDIVYTHT